MKVLTVELYPLSTAAEKAKVEHEEQTAQRHKLEVDAKVSKWEVKEFSEL